jgi:mRNA turnover protein 4
MPKSKRNKYISLTKTEKRVSERKESLVKELREAVDQYSAIYLLNFVNVRSSHFKDVRTKWPSSRFFLGKNKVMQVALGRTKDEERAKDIHKLSRRLVGNSGLLFTNSSHEDVVSFFKTYRPMDYARSGFCATQTIDLPEGPLQNFSHSLEPFLRKLGMPTKLNKGVIHLERPYTVCREGDVLTPEQAKILKLLEIKLSKFTITLPGVWRRGDGDDASYQDLDTEEEVEE